MSGDAFGFPSSSAGKESACNIGDPGLIPGLGRSTGEGIGYPLQYSWASLVAQLVKNPPAMGETWVQSDAFGHPDGCTRTEILLSFLQWAVSPTARNESECESCSLWSKISVLPS